MVQPYLSPLGLIMWIAALEMISGLLLIIVVNSIIAGYFKAKEAHAKRVADSVLKVGTAALEEANKRIQEKLEKKEVKKE